MCGRNSVSLACRIWASAHAKRKEEAYMAKWLKGIAYLSAFEVIEQIKHAADEEEKKHLIQIERERKSGIGQT